VLEHIDAEEKKAFPRLKEEADPELSTALKFSYDFFRPERFRRERLRATFAPERRASLSPMAMACFRLFTFLRERPERSFPRFISCIERFTFLRDVGPYLRLRPLFFLGTVDSTFALPRAKWRETRPP
jgi:hypothetical protein